VDRAADELSVGVAAGILMLLGAILRELEDYDVHEAVEVKLEHDVGFETKCAKFLKNCLRNKPLPVILRI
jgi:hypothetical protein